MLKVFRIVLITNQIPYVAAVTLLTEVKILIQMKS